MRVILGLLFLLTLPLRPAHAEEGAPPPATPVVLMYDAGTLRSDKSFTDSAISGAELAKRDLGVAFEAAPVAPDSNREELLEKTAAQHPPLIIAVGFQYVRPVLAVAEKHPNVRFTVIDGIVPPVYSNVQSVIFKDHEGAFLVGMMAASVSKTGKIGFIGGMDVPLIRNFAFGYRQGAQRVTPNIVIVQDMIGVTQAAWSNPDKAAKLAGAQFDQDVDVVFAAAGGSSQGVLLAAKQRGRYAIGVDTNQNGLYPGTVVTSMVKRVDKAVYEAVKQIDDKTWEPGIKYLGIKEGALDYAVDTHNRDLISKAIIDRIETAKDLIIRGMLEVNVYTPQ